MRRLKNKNKGTVYSVLACIGVVATGASASIGTNMATKKIKKKKPKTLGETVCIAAPYMAPSVIIGTCTIIFIRNADVINKREIKEIGAAYIVTDKAYKAYKDVVRKELDAETVKNIEKKAAQELIDKRPVPSTVVNICEEDYLFYDERSDTYFMSTEQKVLNVADGVNSNMRSGYSNDAALNELYSGWGIGCKHIGEIQGFNVEFPVELTLIPARARDGRPCFVIQYATKYDYIYSNH